MEVQRIARSEALLDTAVELTFPASDPISIDHAFYTARGREEPAARSASSGKAAERARGVRKKKVNRAAR